MAITATRIYTWTSGGGKLYGRTKTAWGNWAGVADARYFKTEDATITGSTSPIGTITKLELYARGKATDYCAWNVYWVLNNGSIVPSASKTYNSNMGTKDMSYSKTVSYDGSIASNDLFLGCAIKGSAASSEIIVSATYPLTVIITYEIGSPLNYYINDEWVKCQAKYYDGENWIDVLPNYYNGSNW